MGVPIKSASTFAGGTTVTAVFGSAAVATANNLLVAFVYSAGYPPTNGINTPSGWTVVDPGVVSSFDERQVGFFVKKAAGGETGVTFTKAGTAQHFEVHVFELAAADVDDVDAIIADTTILLGEQVHNNSSVTSLDITPINPSYDGESTFVAGVGVAPTYITGVSANNSYTAASSVVSSGRAATFYRSVTDPGSTGTTISWTGSVRPSGLHIFIPGPSEAASPPVASAGVDQNPTRSVTVTLDGTDTTGADTYLWTQVSGPESVSITDATTNEASVNLTLAGTYVFELEATNEDGSTTDEVSIVVTPDVEGSPTLIWKDGGWT